VAEVKVIFFDVQRNGESFRQDLQRSPDFKLIASVTTLNELNNAVKGADASGPGVIVLLYCVPNVNITPEVFLYIAEAQLKTVAVCGSVAQGFGLLKRGVNDMVVSDDNKTAFFFKSLASRSRTLLEEAGKQRAVKREIGTPVRSVVAMGSSTGGTESIVKIVEQLPHDTPPVLIVQHMPPIFTNLFAKRLNGLAKMTVWEARDGDELKNGLLLIAPGDRQMLVESRAGKLVVNCSDERPVSGHCPSVDALFRTVASVVGRSAIGVILTGMGADGAKGMLEMYKSGAYTIGQDKESSVVYGMPKAAYDIGAVGIQLHLDKIAEAILAQAAKIK